MNNHLLAEIFGVWLSKQLIWRIRCVQEMFDWATERLRAALFTENDIIDVIQVYLSKLFDEIVFKFLMQLPNWLFKYFRLFKMHKKGSIHRWKTLFFAEIQMSDFPLLNNKNLWNNYSTVRQKAQPVLIADGNGINTLLKLQNFIERSSDFKCMQMPHHESLFYLSRRIWVT